MWNESLRMENGASTPRLDYSATAPGVYKAMDALDQYVADCGLESSLVLLVQLYVSQINGCAYCVDMHWKQLKAAGESDVRLYSLGVWRDSPYYSDRERAALMWAESVTLVTKNHVPDALHQEASRHFNERSLADLTLAIVAINGWNRLSIAARLLPGSFSIGT
ncbi:MAG TPA: carboxymuconolactone decarboxylase family protein [Gemmatimonadaceae bacterium]